MKFMHLADLHIGKRVNGFSMIEDQKYIIKEILAIASEERPDGVLIAGDVYDKNIPSEEAVKVLDAFLVELAELVPDIFLISGNHDSAERVSFGSRIMEARGIHIAPVYNGRILPYVLKKGEEEVCIWMIPFLKPSDIRRTHDDLPVSDYNEACRIAVDELAVDEGCCNIAVAHQFLTGGSRSESEETVGSLENVDAGVFHAFDYVALGHLHGPQKVGRESVRYAGSPLKYSFSEYDQKKSVTIVETAGKEISLQTRPLSPLHELQKIRGSFEEITDVNFYTKYNCDDYMMITLTDESDVPDAGARLRKIYPQWMVLGYDNARTRGGFVEVGTARMEKIAPFEVFSSLFRAQNEREMTEEQKDFLQELLREMTEENTSEEGEA